VKENVPVNIGPPKDLTKLKAPSSLSYDPIEDAPFYKGQPVPFGFLTRALSEIELCKGQKSKDAIKEIIANVFRSAILLSPNELADLFYFFCIKLAPEYEGLETGIGHEILLKSVAKACGKSPTQIRDSFKKEGDLGLVVQLGKSTQNTLGSFFTKKTTEAKAALNFKTVFEAFKKISKTSGNSSQ
jgi:DNA ligase 1